MPSPLRAVIDDLLPVMRHGDLAGFQRIFTRLDDRGLARPPRNSVIACRQLPTAHPARRPADRRSGAYIYPEGRPADIPLTEGARVIVLHPPRGDYGWSCGRTYEHMVPALTLDHIMTPDQADTWRARIAPARETGLGWP